MKQIAITYVATKTIVVNVNPDGSVDNYPEPVDPKGMKEIIKKVEEENAPDIMIDWITDGYAKVSVQVEEID